MDSIESTVDNDTVETDIVSSNEEPLLERRKTRRDDTSAVSQRKKDREKLPIKHKIIIKRSPKVGEGEEFKAVTSVDSHTPSTPSSPGVEDINMNGNLREEESMDTNTKELITPKHEIELDSSLPGVILKQEHDTEDSCDQSEPGKLLSQIERMGSEESQASDASGPSFRMCALCNCGGKSLLGQGDLVVFDPTPGFNPLKRPLQRKKSSSDLDENKDDDKSDILGKHSTWRRKRGPPKIDIRTPGDKPAYKTPRRVYSQVDENGVPIAGVDELSLVGHQDDTEVCHVFDKNGQTWVHNYCALWSDSVILQGDMNLINVDKAVFSGLSNKCSYCRRYGATIRCKEPKCEKRYHYPCASGGGCFQEFHTRSLLCPEHTDKAEKIAGNGAQCVVCDIAGNISEQLFCTSCGQHYHGNCLDPPVEVNPIVRAGWQCPECKICQTCRQPGDDNKMLVCDTCDKGYHTFCLKPAMTTIPKNGWKCKNCRVCGDCGARTPGNGPSSRWHLNFSVCDSCYQQRNKGLCCPVCNKAYRQFTQKEMLECGQCKKFVHAACDPSTKPDSLRRQGNKVINYSCPQCTNKDPSELQAELSGLTETLTELVDESGLQDIESFEMFKYIKNEDNCDRLDAEGLQTSQDSLPELREDSSSMDVDLQPIDTKIGLPIQPSLALKPSGLEIAAPKPVGPGRGKPPIGKKIGKKPSTGRPRGRPIGSFGIAKRAKNQISNNTTSTMSVTERPGKIAPKIKIKVGALPGTSSIAQSRWTVNDDDDPKATTVICSIKDDFMVKQDMCMSCGSLGKDKEGELISCTQCGQCYHPYCVDVKISKVILEKGWRCLDCTVCEGCGQPSDEGRLILCDECDVSYHIYCLDPPLEKVPKGTWKCKWCVECNTCGVTTPGFASMWQNNYSQCGKCASLAKCPICENHYREDDSIIQCSSCDRWLHMHCDNINSEDDAERATDYGYHCLFCRPITGRHGPLPPEPPPSPEPVSPPPVVQPGSGGSLSLSMPSPFVQDQLPKLDIPLVRPPPRQHLLDGICLTDKGRSLITDQAQTYEFKRPRGRRGARGSGLTRGGSLLPINRLLSTDSKVSEEDISFDDNKDSLDGEDVKFPGDTPPHPGLMDGGDILPSPEKEPFEIPGLSGMPPATGRGSRGARNPRMRIGMGVGGFIARSRARGSNVRGRGLGRGTSNLLGRGGSAIDAKKRRPTKKSQLEDSFPAYLQEAFFGRPILDNADDGMELNDEVYSADVDSGFAESITEVKSSIKLKDPHVFNEEEENTAQKEKAALQQQQTNPMLSVSALTPRSNSQNEELELSGGIKTGESHTPDNAADPDSINDPLLMLPDLEFNNIFKLGNTTIFEFDEIHDNEGNESEPMEHSQSGGPSIDDHSAAHVRDWLTDAEYDVDKKINDELINDSELAQIDSKVIEEVLNFKEVLDQQQMTSPTSGEAAFQLPPLPSPPGQGQHQDHSPFQPHHHLPQLQNHPHQPTHESTQLHHDLHAPSPSQQLHGKAHPAGESQQSQLSAAAAAATAAVQGHLQRTGHSAQSPILGGPPLHTGPTPALQSPHNSGPSGSIGGFNLQQQAPSLSEFMQSMAEGVMNWPTSSQPSPQARGQPAVSVPVQSLPSGQGQTPNTGAVPGQQKPQLQSQLSTASDEPEPEHLSWNKKNIMKWEKDEPLGHMATISPVLYANINRPDLKTQYPEWNERAKQIAKIWRRVPTEDRAPYLDKARENRAANRRIKKANKLKTTARDNRANYRLNKAQKLSQEVKRRNKDNPIASMPPPSTLPPGVGPQTPDGSQITRMPGMGPPTPDGSSQLPRIPSQDQLSGMSPSTGSQPHTPGSEVGTPVKPGTPVDPRTVWDTHEGQSPTGLQSSTVTLPSIQLKEVTGAIFKTPQPPVDSRNQDMFADTQISRSHGEQHLLSRTVSREQQQSLHGQLQNVAEQALSFGENLLPQSQADVVSPGFGSNGGINASPVSIHAHRGPLDHHASPVSSMGPPSTVSSPRSGSDMFGQPGSGGLHQNIPGSPAAGFSGSVDLYARQPATPMSVDDPYAHPPSTPRTPQDPYSRPPGTPRAMDEQFVHQQSPMQRTSQEQSFGPRFPSPSPRMAVPFSTPQQRQPIAQPPQPQQSQPSPMPADPYSRPPMTPRGPSPRNPVQYQLPQQPPMTSGPYGPPQPPHTSPSGSLAEMHPEMQQMLASQRFPGQPHPGMTSYRHSYYGNRPPWSPYPHYNRGEEKDNLDHQQLRDLLAKQSKQRQGTKKIGEQDVGGQVPLHHWPEEGGAAQQQQFIPPPMGYPSYSQDPSAGPRPPPPPNYSSAGMGGPQMAGASQPPWGHETGVGRPMRPEMFGPRPPHGFPQELRGMRPGHPGPGYFPRGFPPRHPGQMPEMRPQDLATPAERHRTPYLQMFQERLRSPQKEGHPPVMPPGPPPRMGAVPPPMGMGDPRQMGPHAMAQMRASMMGQPPRGPHGVPIPPPVVQRLPGQPQLSALQHQTGPPTTGVQLADVPSGSGVTTESGPPTGHLRPVTAQTSVSTIPMDGSPQQTTIASVSSAGLTAVTLQQQQGIPASQQAAMAVSQTVVPTSQPVHHGSASQVVMTQPNAMMSVTQSKVVVTHSGAVVGEQKPSPSLSQPLTQSGNPIPKSETTVSEPFKTIATLSAPVTSGNTVSVQPHPVTTTSVTPSSINTPSGSTVPESESIQTETVHAVSVATNNKESVNEVTASVSMDVLNQSNVSIQSEYVNVPVSVAAVGTINQSISRNNVEKELAKAEVIPVTNNTVEAETVVSLQQPNLTTSQVVATETNSGQMTTKSEESENVNNSVAGNKILESAASAVNISTQPQETIPSTIVEKTSDTENTITQSSTVNSAQNIQSTDSINIKPAQIVTSAVAEPMPVATSAEKKAPQTVGNLAFQAEFLAFSRRKSQEEAEAANKAQKLEETTSDEKMDTSSCDHAVTQPPSTDKSASESKEESKESKENIDTVENMQTDGCFDCAKSDSDTDCDSEVEKIFDRIHEINYKRVQNESYQMCAAWLETTTKLTTAGGQVFKLSPIGCQVDGAGDDDKTNQQQNQVNQQGFPPHDSNMMYQTIPGGVQQVLGNFSNPSSPALSIKSPPGTPRTPKTPPGPKSPQRGHPLAGMHMTGPGQPMISGHPGAGIRSQMPTGKGLMGQRPTTPLGHMQQGGGSGGGSGSGVPPGPTMGNPPPPYPVQQSAGKSPKSSQSPRPSPKPSPLQGQMIPSPHHVTSPHAVPSPHSMQSPLPGSRSTTPQMSPRGSHSGSQPGTPQAALQQQHPGFPPPGTPTGPGQPVHIGGARMPIQTQQGTTPQAAMAQLASMAQPTRPPGTTVVSVPYQQGMMPPDGSRPPHTVAISQGMMPPGMRPPFPPHSGQLGGPPGVASSTPSSVAAMLGQQRPPGEMMLSQTVYRTAGPPPGQQYVMGGVGGPLQRPGFPPGAMMGNMPPQAAVRQRGPAPQMQMMGFPPGTAPSSQPLPMQGMRAGGPPHPQFGYGPPRGMHPGQPRPGMHPGHPGMQHPNSMPPGHPTMPQQGGPPRGFTQGEVQIQTMPNLALAHQTQLQAQGQALQGQGQNMNTPAQAALSSLAQAHGTPLTPGHPGVIPQTSAAFNQPAAVTISQVASTASNVPSSATKVTQSNASTTTTNAKSTAASDATATTSSLSSVLPDSIAAILSQASKEQAQLKAAAASQGGGRTKSPSTGGSRKSAAAAAKQEAQGAVSQATSVSSQIPAPQVLQSQVQASMSGQPMTSIRHMPPHTQGGKGNITAVMSSEAMSQPQIMHQNAMVQGKPPPHMMMPGGPVRFQGQPPPPHIMVSQAQRLPHPPGPAGLRHPGVSEPTARIPSHLIQGLSSKDRTLLLNEQPLLLEDLLEQVEKVEQQRKHAEEHSKQIQGGGPRPSPGVPQTVPQQPLLSDSDFEKLKADVIADTSSVHRPPGPPIGTQPRPPHLGEGWLGQHMGPGPPPPPGGPAQHPSGMFHQPPRQHTPQLSPRTPSPFLSQSPVGATSGLYSGPPAHSPVVPSPQPAPQKPAQPPMREPQNDQERQQHMQYDQWLNTHAAWVGGQIKDLEAKVGKHRKLKKSLAAKQRNARKNGNELTVQDQASLANATEELTPLVKQLDSLRKQQKSHTNTLNDYKTKVQEWMGISPWGPPPGQSGPPQPSQLGPPPPQGQLGPPPQGQPPVGPNQMGPPPAGLPQGTIRPPHPPQTTVHVQQQTSTAPAMQLRIPGAAAPNNQPLRLPAQVRQEYENHMLQRIRQINNPAQQGPPSQGMSGMPQMSGASQQKTMLLSGPSDPPDFQHLTHFVHYQQDENNPFSDTYQQREQVVKVSSEDEQRQQIQRHIEQQQKVLQQDVTAKQPPPYTTDSVHFPGSQPVGTQPPIRIPGPRMPGDTVAKLPGEARHLGPRIPGDMQGHLGARIPGDISHAPRMAAEMSGHPPRIPGDISQHGPRIPSTIGGDQAPHGIRMPGPGVNHLGPRIPGDISQPRMDIGHGARQGVPRMPHFPQGMPFSTAQLHQMAAPGQNIHAGTQSTETLITQTTHISVAPTITTVTSSVAGPPGSQITSQLVGSHVAPATPQAQPQISQAPVQISQALQLPTVSHALPPQTPQMSHAPPMSMAQAPTQPHPQMSSAPHLSTAPPQFSQAVPPASSLAPPHMPHAPPPSSSMPPPPPPGSGGLVGGHGVQPPLASPNQQDGQIVPGQEMMQGMLDKPGNVGQTSLEVPKKKKRKRKKKADQQQQEAAANQMQLPLDLDLQPMRMPSLPQFPPDFNLGSSPHTGLVPQSPIQSQPPSLQPPPHHQPPASMGQSMQIPHPRHHPPGQRPPHPPLLGKPGGIMGGLNGGLGGDKSGMSELEKLVNMQGPVMQSDLSKSQVAESMAAIQQHLQLKQQQQHQVASSPMLPSGVPISQPVPPQVTATSQQPDQQQFGGPQIPPHININQLDMKAVKSQLSPNSQNIFLKQLMASNRSAAAAASMGTFDKQTGMRRPPSRSLSETTEDADESVNLTPEQQRQLMMIENMPLTIEKDITVEEWAMKTPEEREQYLEAAENQKKMQQYDFAKEAAELEQIAMTPKKKRRRKKDMDPNNPDKPVKKRPRKPSTTTPVLPPMKEDSGPDFTALVEQIMSQIRLLPRLPLQEPEVLINFLGMKDEQELLGIFGYGSQNDIVDHYCVKPYISKPPTTVFNAEKRRLFHKYASPYTAMPWIEQDNKLSQFIDRARPQLPDKPEMPSPPLIQPRQVNSRASDKSPATIIDTSSPETGFEDQKPQYPGLRLISHEEGKSEEEKQRECGSPEIPVMCPVPVKPTPLLPIKEEVKEEQAATTSTEPVASTSLPEEKPAAVASGIDKAEENEASEPGDETSNQGNEVKDVNNDQALGRLVRDPNEVSVTLTLNPKAADNIAGVMAAIADLLKIAVPATYEVSRSPSPPPQPQPANATELFNHGTGVPKYKEEAIHLQNLLKTEPKFCRHCELIVLSGGVRRKKSDFSFLQQDKYDFLDYGNEVITFCSSECFNQFDDAQRNASFTFPKGSFNESSVDPKQLDSSFSSVIHPSPTTSATLSIPETTTPDRHDGHRSGFSTIPATPDRHDSNQSFHSPSAPLTPLDKTNLRRKSVSKPAVPLFKKWRGSRYKKWSPSMGRLEQIHKIPPTESELHELMMDLAVTMRPKRTVKDQRACALCADLGCLEADGPGRLLNMDVDKYIHLNCALWSYEVYETVSGALMNVDQAVKRGATTDCMSCHKRGATLGCFKQRCVNQYHLLCARKEGMVFFQDKTLLCPVHCPKGTAVEGELKDLSVYRKVYINREENRQVASIIHMEEKKFLVRVGSVIIQQIGQLLPHQIATGRFNTGDYIYPVSYKSTRYYWSYRRQNKRCKYVCRINDQDGWPEFTITVIEEGFDKVTHRDLSATGVWLKVLAPYDKLRRDNDMLKMFPSYLCGEDLFGLTEPTVLRIIESLPGVELMANYRFKFGRSSLYKMPITVNPTGCARSEPKLRTHFKKPHTLHTSGHTRTLPQTVAVVTDFNIPYSKQFVHSKSQQYRRLKTEWRNNVYLRRSNVQGLGLFAARDLEKHTMVIEYIGELIRNEVAEHREKIYEQQHRGIYMFRIDDNTVVDATMTGGPARYINHSCSPNCVAEVVQFEKDSKIIIITKRRILKGEELTYDYKFDFEDDQHKIPCLCGAANCRKWMN